MMKVEKDISVTPWIGTSSITITMYHLDDYVISALLHQGGKYHKKDIKS